MATAYRRARRDGCVCVCVCARRSVLGRSVPRFETSVACLVRRRGPGTVTVAKLRSDPVGGGADDGDGDGDTAVVVLVVLSRSVEWIGFDRLRQMNALRRYIETA